jgi:hypothetical protein
MSFNTRSGGFCWKPGAGEYICSTCGEKRFIKAYEFFPYCNHDGRLAATRWKPVSKEVPESRVSRYLKNKQNKTEE